MLAVDGYVALPAYHELQAGLNEKLDILQQAHLQEQMNRLS